MLWFFRLCLFAYVCLIAEFIFRYLHVCFYNICLSNLVPRISILNCSNRIIRHIVIDNF